MKISKIQKMDMHVEKILWYSLYVDCFSRILNEFIQNGDDNISEFDVPNLMYLMQIFSHRLRRCILNMSRDWEFM